MVMLYGVLFCMVIGFCKSRVLSFTISEDNAVAVIRLGGLNLLPIVERFQIITKVERRANPMNRLPASTVINIWSFLFHLCTPSPSPPLFLRGGGERGGVGLFQNHLVVFIKPESFFSSSSQG